MTPDEMRADIIKRIVALRKTKEDAHKNTQLANDVMKAWMSGAKPAQEIIQQAATSIQIRDHISIFCYDQEQALRKLASDKGIIL